MISAAKVWSDGSGPAGPGRHCGWAALVQMPGHDPVLQAGHRVGLQSANVVELLAVLEGMEALHWLGYTGDVVVYCDNMWVVGNASIVRRIDGRKTHSLMWKRFDRLALTLGHVDVRHIPRVSTPEARIVDGVSKKVRRQREDGKFH